VADGAVSFLIDHYITARVARNNFGTKSLVLFDENDVEHQLRSGTMFTDDSGSQVIPHFCVILAKVGFSPTISHLLEADIDDSCLSQGTCVSETTPFRQSFECIASKKSEFRTVTKPILVYKGDKLNPQWLDIEPGGFVHARCQVVNHA
jgi:hypothetical protein